MCVAECGCGSESSEGSKSCEGYETSKKQMLCKRYLKLAS